jgi:hypothetical protein
VNPSPWLTSADLKIEFKIGYDKAEIYRNSGEWPRGYVWQKTADGRTGKIVYRREAIEAWLATCHDPIAWQRAIDQFLVGLPGNQPRRPGRPPKSSAA